MGDTRAAAVELVHRMEGSKHFQGAQLVDERSGESGAGVVASVIAVYVPDSTERSGKVMPDLGNSRRKLKLRLGRCWLPM